MKTIFLDRDGVINRNLDNDYVKHWDEFVFLPNTLKAIKLLTDEGYRLIIVTNQSCVNKQIISLTRLNSIHQRMCLEIEQAGGWIEAIYFCPHRDDEGCDCRKPKPGMLIQAAHEHTIDLPNSYMIGDSIRDIEAGQRVGCHALLVLTGHGSHTHQQQIEGSVLGEKPRPEKVFTDLYAATLWILSI